MKKRIKILGVMLSVVISFSIFAVLKLNKTAVNAYTGLRTDLTEKELYNATNTYNVIDSKFDKSGTFLATTESDASDRINKTQYKIRLNIS